MALIKGFGRKRAWVLSGVCGVAIAAWGIYAWRFSEYAGGSRPAVTQEPEVTGLTTLAATRRPTRANRLTDLSSWVRPNAPASIGDAVEAITGSSEDEPPIMPETTILKPAPDKVASTNEPEQSVAADSSVASGARAALEQGDLISARSAFSKALDQGLASPEAESIRNELADLAEVMLFSRASNANDPLTSAHMVESGESLYVIARRYKITQKLLATINRISNPNRIRAGSRLKTIQGPFNAVVWKSEHRMDMYLGDTYIRSFRVGLGTNGGTPVGRWIVKSKLENPDWIDPTSGRHYLKDDPKNPIGERWIGLKCIEGECVGREGYGIHGTIEPESIGADMSMGCVRLGQDDVVLVYDLLVRQHSQVEIRP